MSGNETKHYLIDTSVIMDDHKVLKKISEGGKNRIYLTDVVLSEIDNHKTSKNPELGFAAREFIRSFVMNSFEKATDEIPPKRNEDFVSKAYINIDQEKVPVFIVTRNKYEEKSDTNDKKIIEVAKDYGCTIITNDAAFRVIAMAEDVKTETLLEGSVQSPEEISFKKTIELDLKNDPLPNPKDVGLSRWGQLIVKDKKTGMQKLFIANGTSFLELNEQILENYTVSPINVEQKFYASVLRDCNSIIVVSGSTGSGKTLLALQEGIKRLQNKEVGGIVYMRYTVNAGDKFSELGYRKGSEEEKLSYFNYPLYGAINFLLENGIDGKKIPKSHASKIGKSKEVADFMNKYNIEVLDIAHARGTTITNRFVIFDELQNTPLPILKLIGTRIGKGSILVLLGDFRQVDHPYLSKNRNALVYMLKKAQTDNNVAGIILEKTVRSATAQWFQDNF